jgi:hypothetical protein
MKKDLLFDFVDRQILFYMSLQSSLCITFPVPLPYSKNVSPAMIVEAIMANSIKYTTIFCIFLLPIESLHSNESI